MAKEIRVFAPASIGNVACGFDVIGISIVGPGDEVVVRPTRKKGVHIVSITGVEGLPMEAEKNTAGLAALKLLEHLGEKRGVEMEIHKRMPIGSGLGSSAASAVAGAYSVNALLGFPLSTKELLPFAGTGEALASGAIHLDNIAPSLLGGMTLVRSNKEFDVVHIPTPTDLYATVVHPNIKLLTKDSRAVIPLRIPLKSAIAQWGNVGGLIAGMMLSDWGLIGRSLQDVVIEPHRARFIPGFYEVKGAAMYAGALGASISGAGPSVFALTKGEETAKKAAAAMQKIFGEKGIMSEAYVSPISSDIRVKVI